MSNCCWRQYASLVLVEEALLSKHQCSDFTASHWTRQILVPCNATRLHCTEFLLFMQESEGEEAAEARVTLAQDMGRGNIASRQSRIRLQEVQSLLNSNSTSNTIHY